MIYGNDLENICYEDTHIAEVTASIKSNFFSLYIDYLDSEAGSAIDIDKLNEHFGRTLTIKKTIEKEGVIKSLYEKAITGYEKDREKYQCILDTESFETYDNNPAFFKDTILRNKCPIIHFTLANMRDKKLDKYRIDFKKASPNDYYSKFDESQYNAIKNLTSMGLLELQEEKYLVYGVIGGGIRSHFLYKLHPDVFPNRSREALWAFYFLTDKKSFSCKDGSEFCMINKKEGTTQQNYFYPYDLFSFYAYQVYLLIKEYCKHEQYVFPNKYRYVIVDDFLKYIHKKHAEDVSVLSINIKDDSYGY
jgi:hypothetical protein